VLRSVPIVLASFFLALTLTGAQAGESCSIPGELIHWKVDFCMYKAETDDFFNPFVQKCFDREEKKVHKSECSAKAEYKRAICRIVATFPPYNGSSKKCFEDKSFSGPTVREGGV
jgi:hypothetical protein